MRFLRSTLVVTKQDMWTNEAIRKTLKVNSLDCTISKYRDNWFNHITRMDHSRFPRYMLSYKPTGKRSLGRPRKRWISQIWGAATDESPMHEAEEDSNVSHIITFIHPSCTAGECCKTYVLNPVKPKLVLSY